MSDTSDITRSAGEDPADDALRRLLRAADPTSPDLGAETSSLEAVMSEITSRPAGTEDGRGRRPWWVFGPAAAGAAAAVLAVIAVGGAIWSQRSAAPAPSAPSAVVLTIKDAPQDLTASCMVPEAKTMRQWNDLAFSATVREVSEQRALFTVDRWYRGGDGATQVALTRTPDVPGILYSPDLKAGQRYLIVAKDGALQLCDPSGPFTAELHDLYVEAFGAGTAVSAAS